MKYYYYKLLYKRKYILFLDTLIRIIKNKFNNKYCYYNTWLYNVNNENIKIILWFLLTRIYKFVIIIV